MTRPIPPELLARIEAHERWLETLDRKEERLVQANMGLHDVDLSGRDLNSALIPGIKLDRARLQGIDLSDTDLNDASFIQALLDEAWLVKTDARNANFSEASMRNARIIRLDIRGGNLQKADLTGSNCYNADFGKANLEAANFSYTDLRIAYFYKARLAHAIFTGTMLRNASLAGATGLESVIAEWIDIGEEGTPERLEGELALRWLREEAAKPLPEWYNKPA